MTKRLLLLNGPNLNLLGTRDPQVYGKISLEEITQSLRKLAKELGFDLKDFQSNSEGALVDAIHEARKDCVGIIINPGAYTHTSIAIRDALEAVNLPCIEVHLSNIFRREEFRRHSYISEVVSGVISGLGAYGYELALKGLAAMLKGKG